MNDSVVITYSGQQVSVPKEVADFLEQDRKREQAQEKQDERHLSKSEFETVLSGSECVRRPVEDTVLWTLRLESLQKAMEVLDYQSRELIDFRYARGLTSRGLRPSGRSVSPEETRGECGSREEAQRPSASGTDGKAYAGAAGR